MNEQQRQELTDILNYPIMLDNEHSKMLTGDSTSIQNHLFRAIDIIREFAPLEADKLHSMRNDFAPNVTFDEVKRSRERFKRNLKWILDTY